MAAYRTAKAVVLTNTGVYYDTGHTHPLSDRLSLNDLGAVLAGAANAFQGGEGVCMIDVDHATATLGLDVLGDEWHYTTLRTWTTFARKDGAVVHLGLLGDLLAEGAKLGPLLNGHQGPADIAARLGRYHQLTGAPWRATAGISGCAALRARYTDPRPGRQPLWRQAARRGVRGLRATGPLIWQAPKTMQPDEGTPGHVVVFDVNAMYLAAMRNAHLAWGPLNEHTGGFEATWPGFWEIDTTTIDPALYDGKYQPPVFPARMIHGNAVWLTTPIIKYIAEITPGWTPDVLTAFISENPHPIGRAYAERLMAARVGDLGPAGPVMPAIKRTYAELVGMMAREGGSIERPDWSATIMDLARVNMLRRLDRVPGKLDAVIVAVRTDAVYFLSHSAMARRDIGAAIGVGTGPGTFKYQETLTVDEYRAKILGAA